jgi:hypothetical protein
MIYCRIMDSGVGRTGFINALDTLNGGLDIVRVIEVGTLRWLGQAFRVQVLDRYSRGQSTCEKNLR